MALFYSISSHANTQERKYQNAPTLSGLNGCFCKPLSLRMYAFETLSFISMKVFPLSSLQIITNFITIQWYTLSTINPKTMEISQIQ